MLMLRPSSRLLLGALLTAAAAGGCGGDNGPHRQEPPPSPNPDTAIPVNGSERIGWSQSADGLDALKALRFIAYVDSARIDLPGWTCGDAPTANGYDCSAPLPWMSKGRHALSIAAILMSPAGTGESRSDPLLLNVGAAVLASATAPTEAPALRLESPAASVASARPTTFSKWADVREGARSLALASPARAFFVSGTGQLTVANTAGAQAIAVRHESGGDVSIADVAVDPEYAATRFVYVAWRTHGGESEQDDVEVVRYREVQNTFGEAASVVGALTLPQDGSVRLRIGPDGKIYMVLTDANRSAILRFNPDGTTPGAHSNASPLFATADSRVTDLAWHPATLDLWTVSATALGCQLRVYDAVDRADLHALPLRGSPTGGVLSPWNSRVTRPSIAFAQDQMGAVTLVIGIQGTQTLTTAGVRNARTLEDWDTATVELPAPLAAVVGTATSRVLVLLSEAGAATIGTLEIGAR